MSVIFENRSSVFAWIAAIVVVVVMGVIVFTGPFHHINKTVAPPTLPTKMVKIVTDPSIAGRYEPHTVTVRVGQPVTFTNVSDAIHTVTADDNQSFNSGDIGTAGQSWTFRPAKAGRYPYHCVYHPYMHGVLVVQG